MTPDEGFESAQQLAAWANSQRQELEIITQAFLDSNPATVIKEINRKTQRWDVKIRSKPMPHRIRGLTGDVIKNLRDALDQSCNAASFMVSGVYKRNRHFPFGTSPDDFDKAVTRNQCKDIPAALYPVLKGYEPYPTGDEWDGGNDFLKLLGVVSGPHKHRFTLSPMPIVPEAIISEVDFYAGVGGGSLFNGHNKDDEFVLATFGPGGYLKIGSLKFPLFVSFTDTKLRGTEIGAFLTPCCESVVSIVQDLQAKSFALVGKA
jgi:hypothetical protein